MKLEPPLLNLISRCETICISECCGIDAYDFSPIHIASYLIMNTGSLKQSELNTILDQLDTLQKRASRGSITINEMNQIFTQDEVDSLVREIKTNIKVALDLIKQIESSRMCLTTN